MDLLHLCPYKTTVVQEFHHKVGEAKLNFIKWYIHVAHDTKNPHKNFFFFSVDKLNLTIIRI